MAERVRVAVAGGIAEVRLNRPEKLNALDVPMFEALVSAGKQLAADRSVRCVVLSGAGRAFCAGLDLALFAAMAQPGAGGRARGLFARELGNPANFAQRAAYVWTAMPAPVIAAVHGVAFGAGLQIALAADLRIVAPDARLAVLEVRWGLIPDLTGSQALRRLVPLDVAKELTFTGREVSGEEAVRLGLATRVSEQPLEDALALAREIAARSPDAVRAAKKLLNSAGFLGLEEGLRLEEELQRSLIAKPNQIEAARANLERREARFTDPE